MISFPRHLHVTVTQQDIEQGIRADCRHCPVALSVGRMFGLDLGSPNYHSAFTFVSVGAGVTICIDGEFVRYKDNYLKADLMYFISSVDNRKSPQPTSFTLHKDLTYALS